MKKKLMLAVLCATMLVGVTPMSVKAAPITGTLKDGTKLTVVGIGAEPSKEIPDEIKEIAEIGGKQVQQMREEVSKTRENYTNVTTSKYAPYETAFAVYNESAYCDNTLKAINDAREKNGLSPLFYDNNLGLAAGKLSLSQISCDYYSIEELYAEAGAPVKGSIAWSQFACIDEKDYANEVLTNHPDLATGNYTNIGIGYCVVNDRGSTKLCYAFY